MSKELERRIRRRLTVAENGCWEYSGHTTKDGYGVIIHKGKMLRVHRAFYEIAKNVKLAENIVVMHKCDNRKCCNPAHLDEGTRADNTADMVKKNRQASGEKNGQSVLSDKQVVEIIKLYSEGGHTQYQLADMFGVRQPHISKIVTKKKRKGVHNE